MHARRRRETENMRVALIWELEESEEDGGKTENRRAVLEGWGADSNKKKTPLRKKKTRASLQKQACIIATLSGGRR